MNKYIKFFINIILSGISLGIISGSLIKLFSLKQVNKMQTSLSKNYIEDIKNNRFIESNKINTNPKEIKLLSEKIKQLAEQNKDLETSAYILLPGKNLFAEFDGDKEISSASTIKIPILLSVLNMIDRKKIYLNETIKLEESLIGGGAGWIAYEKPGSFFPVYELATEMIRVSDNTATNLLIDRLGGIDEVNQSFISMGLTQTKINNLLPDLEGTNVSTVKDLIQSIALIDSGVFTSLQQRDLFRDIMSTSKSNNLIPKGILNSLGVNGNNVDYQLLIKGYRVFNKTGDIGTTYADVALIEMPDGVKAYVGINVKGPFNDTRSADLIREISKSFIDFIKSESMKTNKKNYQS